MWFNEVVGAHESSTFLTYVFVGILILGAVFLAWAVFDKKNKRNLSPTAAKQYGEDMVTLIELTAKDMVPRFPHLGVDEVTALVMSRLAARAGSEAKLYEFSVRQVVARLKGESMHGAGGSDGSAPTEGGGGVTQWTD